MASIPNDNTISVTPQLKPGPQLAAPLELATESFDDVLKASSAATHDRSQNREDAEPPAAASAATHDRSQNREDAEPPAAADVRDQSVTDAQRQEDAEPDDVDAVQDSEASDDEEQDEELTVETTAQVEIADESLREVVEDEQNPSDVDLEAEEASVELVEAEPDGEESVTAGDAGEDALDEAEAELLATTDDRRADQSSAEKVEQVLQPVSSSEEDAVEAADESELQLLSSEGADERKASRRHRSEERDPTDAGAPRDLAESPEARGGPRSARVAQPLATPSDVLTATPEVESQPTTSDTQPALAQTAEQPGASQPRWQQQLTGKVQSDAQGEGRPVHVDTGRFLTRVSRAFQAARNQDGQIRLRLSPPELGSLRLEIKVQGGALTARIEAETPAARALLVDNVGALRERLADQGIRIEQFDVDLLDRQSDDLDQSRDETLRDQNRHDTQSSDRSDAANSTQVNREDESEPTSITNTPDVKRLDVKV